MFLYVSLLRIYEEIQKIEANEFHYQEQVEQHRHTRFCQSLDGLSGRSDC